jgi:hypothetical protein
MAITKIKPIKVRLDHVLKYASNETKTTNENYGNLKYQDLHNVLDYVEADYKTEKKLYVTGINCNAENAYEQMKITKQIYEKEDGILAFHLIQSFDEDENVTPELAHKIGIELCNELFADRFECVVSTHLNTKHYHNHIVINSVSFRDGKKYYNNNKTYAAIRKTSDNLCKEYKLKVIGKNIGKKGLINYDNYYKKYASENNYKNTTKKDIDFAIGQAFSFEDFKSIMKKLDYEIIFRSGKISVRHKKYNRNIRIERAFGEDYSIERIKQRIIEEETTRIPFIDAYKFKGTSKKYKGTYKKSKKKAKGFIALYYHYCFLLKVFPNTKNINKRLPASIRADVKIMDRYSEEAKFLNSNNLNTDIELNNYKENITNDLTKLLSERESLWRYRKLEQDQEKQKSICNQISDINFKIENIRKELRLVEDIEKRIPKMKENLKELKKEKKERKEKNKDEYIK